MKDVIINKINAHVASILNKDAIDFFDYQILCAELARLEAKEASEKMDAENKDRSARMMQMLAEVFR